MKFTENRKIAGVILSAVIIGMILIDGGCDLRRERQKNAELYYTGVEADGLSIYNDLEARCAAGNNLIAVLQRYLSADSAELSDFAYAINAVKIAGSPSEAYTANVQLTQETERIYALLEAQELSEKDEELAAGQYAELVSRNRTLEHDGYNEKATEFNQQLNRFPAGIIAAVNGIEALELFQ